MNKVDSERDRSALASWKMDTCASLSLSLSFSLSLWLLC